MLLNFGESCYDIGVRITPQMDYKIKIQKLTKPLQLMLP